VGKPIGKHQLVQRLIADSATYVDAARLLAYRALYQFDNGEQAGAESAMAKWFATEAAVTVASNAIQSTRCDGPVAGTRCRAILP